MAVVKARGPGISQSEKGVEPGPARAGRRYEVEGVVSPLSTSRLGPVPCGVVES